MPLKVRKADKHVRIHHGAADLRFLYVFAAYNRHGDVVRALESVPDQDGAAHGHRRKAVFPCAIQVLKRIFAAAGIHGVAIRQKRLPAFFLHQIRNGLRIIRAQIADVAELAEMHFNCHELAFHIDRTDARPAHQLFQLCGQPVAIGGRTEIRKINLRFFHDSFAPVLSFLVKPL